MPKAPLIFGNLQESSNEALSGASPLAINVISDGRGTVRRRPGISTWSTFPETVAWGGTVTGISLFRTSLVWLTQEAANKTAWSYLSGGAAVSLSANTTYNSFLWGTDRPVLVGNEYRVAATTGQYPGQVRAGDSLASFLGDYGTGDSYVPTYQTTMACFANSIVANDATDATTADVVAFSGLGLTGQEDWDPLDYVTSDARPDAIVAIRENVNEVYVFGESSLQVFVPDENSFLAPARTLNVGCAAAASVVFHNEGFYWLDEKRRFVFSDGRQVQVVSDPIAQTVKDIGTVSDCWGFRLFTGRSDSLVWVFPTDTRTFALQVGGGWSQWHGWDRGHRLWAGRSVFAWESENVTLVGLDDGIIGKFDASSGADMGVTFKAEVLTGYIDRDTQALKLNRAVRLRFKRGQSATSSVVRLSWRDDAGAWSMPIDIDLGAYGDSDPVVVKHSLGTYRQRQWKLEMTDADDLVLVGVEEDFEILSN
jgi:hypothetical protein